MADKPAPSAATVVAETAEINPWAGASMSPEEAKPTNQNLDPLHETALLAGLGVGHFGLFNPIDISLDAVRGNYVLGKGAALGQKPDLILRSALMGVKGGAYTAASNRLAESDLGESRIEEMLSFSAGGGDVNS